MNRENKLVELRKKMTANGIAVVIIPSTDPHSSEYVHGHWKTRAWFSGFNGSAGTLVITKEESGLWTDFRYFIEAAEAIKGSEVKLYKDGVSGTPSIAEFIKSKIGSGDNVGIDGSLFPTSEYDKYKKEFKDTGIKIVTDFDPVKNLWLDRPGKPMSEAFELPVKYCGESREDKIKRVRDIMAEKKLDYYIISSLADIAWLLNIRGADVNYTPLIVSYVILSKKNTSLFIDPNKLSRAIRDILVKSGITIKKYDSIADYIVKLKSDARLYYMPQMLNCFLSGLIPQSINVVKGLDITADLKAVKNDIEIKNFRIAMEKDGAALVKFFKTFRERMEYETFTEYTLAPLLRECRLSMDGCVDESFGPIIGYHSNGALCHYSADVDSAKEIKKGGLLLIDSGGQYFEGTTDITRTISLGHATVEEILHYTLVLQGHIKLSMARFPEGTTGTQLDVLAREPLWNRGLNYGHGTGHGVGFFLGVHEGPQSISPKSNTTVLKEGMVTSNEPGIYIEGKHGIRIENLILTRFEEDGLEQKFLGFETLTLFPYDLDLVDPELLLQKEIDWINSYHKEVRNRLSAYLNKDEFKWLEGITREI